MVIDPFIGGLFASVVCVVIAILLGRAFSRTRLALVLVNGIWVSVFVVIASGLIRYTPSTGFAWVVLLCGVVACDLGFVVGELLHRRVRMKSTAVMGDTRRVAIVNRTTYLVLLVILIVVELYYLYQLQKNFGLTAILTNPAAVRGNKEIGYLELVPGVLRVAFLYSPLLFALSIVPNSVYPGIPLAVRIFGVVCCVLCFASLLQRTNFFYGVLLASIVLLIRPRDKRQAADFEQTGRIGPQGEGRRVLFGGIVGVVILVVGFAGVGAALGKTGQSAARTGNVTSVLENSGLTDLVVYTTSGSAAFLHLVDSDTHSWPPVGTSTTTYSGPPPVYDPPTGGTATLFFLAEFLGAEQQWQRIAPFADVGIPTNVFTWFEPFYRDFRLGGVILLPFAYCLITGWLFCCRKQSSIAVWGSGIMLTGLVLGPFSTLSGLIYVSAGILLLLGICSHGLTVLRR